MHRKQPDTNQPQVIPSEQTPSNHPLPANTLNLIARYLSWETTPEEDNQVLELMKIDPRVQRLVSDGIHLEGDLIKPATTQQQEKLNELNSVSAEELSRRVVQQSFNSAPPEWAVEEQGLRGKIRRFIQTIRSSFQKK